MCQSRSSRSTLSSAESPCRDKVAKPCERNRDYFLNKPYGVGCIAATKRARFACVRTATITNAATRRCLSATRRHRAAQQCASPIHILRTRKGPRVIDGIAGSTKVAWSGRDPEGVAFEYEVLE